MAELKSRILRANEQTVEKQSAIRPIARNNATRNFAMLFWEKPKDTQKENQLCLFDAMANITTLGTGDSGFKVRLLHEGKTKVKITDVEDCMFDMIVASFTAQKPFKSKTDLLAKDCTVYLDIKEIMYYSAKEGINDKFTKYNFKKRLYGALVNLRRIEIEYNRPRNNTLFTGGFIASIGQNKDYFIVDLNPRFANDLLQRNFAVQSAYDMRGLKYALNNQGGNKTKSFAFRLSKYLTAYANIDNNIKKAPDGIYTLKVATIIEHLRFLLDTQNRKHPERDIIKPICDALDILKKDGILKDWYFTEKGKTRLTETELSVAKTRYSTFITKSIAFEMTEKNPLHRLVAIETTTE